jgi:hypothetical protein
VVVGLDRHSEKIPGAMGDERHFRGLMAFGG